MIESKHNEMDWATVNSAWSRADKAKPERKPMKKDMPPVPDGRYVACSSSVLFTTTNKSGKPCLLWMLDIQEGPHASRRVFKRNMLVEKSNMEFLEKDLHTCKVALPEQLSDLDTTKLEDLTLAITVKTKTTDNGSFTDVYINRLVDMEDATSNVTNAYNDDDIPF